MMLKSLKNLLHKKLDDTLGQDSDQRKHVLQLSTATLLVEVMRADYREDLIENEVIFHLLKEFFNMSNEEAALLLEEAESEADQAISLQGFTRFLHENLTIDEKHSIVEMLWKVALADQNLDKHEDHLVRKVSSLLYVSQRDLIKIRNRVKYQ